MGLHPSGHLQFSSHSGTQTEKIQFATGAKKIQRKHLRHDSESANLPFGADNLKLDMVQFQIISLCYGRGLNLQIQNSALINIDSERNLEYG